MQCWVNKVAIVTDCGDEVGFMILEQLAKAGMIVIGFSKHEDTLEKVTEKLKPLIANKITGKVVLCRCDITNIKQLESAFEKIKDTYEGIDVLINNAYCNSDCLVNTGSLEDFREIIDVNIYAVVAFTRLVAATMIERKTRGHIICINDLCSYQIPIETRKSVFIATKAAITSVNEILRHEFRFLKANIKVTNIACGSIESSTEIAPDEPKLRIRDVAKLVKLILNTPEQLQVHEVLLDSVTE
ncbi:farnesol dehydrogenase-like [Anticarsia gemmatalis]|uniref:farnesol dehydrogenase-like n=1 Tax=Anticarsia gemmatalis TaxID=129554 RepID=UPI003F76A8A1